MDIVYLSLLVGFTVLALALVRLAERLGDRSTQK